MTTENKVNAIEEMTMTELLTGSGFFGCSPIKLAFTGNLMQFKAALYQLTLRHWQGCLLDADERKLLNQVIQDLQDRSRQPKINEKIFRKMFPAQPYEKATGEFYDQQTRIAGKTADKLSQLTFDLKVPKEHFWVTRDYVCRITRSWEVAKLTILEGGWFVVDNQIMNYPPSECTEGFIIGKHQDGIAFGTWLCLPPGPGVFGIPRTSSLKEVLAEIIKICPQKGGILLKFARPGYKVHYEPVI